MARIVKTRVETEGKVHEEFAVVEDESLEAWGDDKTAAMRYVGKATPRIEGIERVTGRAKFTHDMQLPGMLHAVLVRSTKAHARVTGLDTSAAEALPGVVGVLTPQTLPTLEGVSPLTDEPIYVGDAVAAVLAESDAIAREAADLVRVTYEVLPFETNMARATDDAERLGEGRVQERGDVEAAFAAADVVLEGTFHTPAAVHHCLETHGSVVQWEGNRLTVWTSTQSPFGVRREVAEGLGLPLTAVRVIKQYMGGGFGSKFGPGNYTFIAAIFAKMYNAPVRCILNRAEEAVATGHRHETIQRYKVGVTRDGRLSAIQLECVGNVGMTGGTFGMPVPALSLYQCDNVRTVERQVKTNLGHSDAFRAPGVVEGTFAFESMIDDVAKAIGMDSLEFRRRNYAERDQTRGLPYSTKTLREMYERGAEAIGWNQAAQPSQPNKKRGKGMASQIWWGGGGPPAYATIRLDSDGKAIVYCGAADLGTGTRTALALIAAEELGFRLQDIVVELGDTLTTPYAPGAGGSMTIASIGSAARGAASDTRTQLIEVAASYFEAPIDVLEVVESEIRNRERPDFRMTVAELMGKLGDVEISGKGSRGPNDPNHAVHTFGVQFADVEVDTDTGEVTVLKMVAIHDSGRIVNPLTAGSQIEGGMIQGLGFGLTEGRIVDDPTGHVVNGDLEGYKLPTAADIPDIEHIFLQTPDTIANSVGAKGVGEPPIIPTAGAIANAVAHAIGTRIYDLPMNRAQVLEALAKAAPPITKPAGNFKPMPRVR